MHLQMQHDRQSQLAAAHGEAVREVSRTLQETVAANRCELTLDALHAIGTCSNRHRTQKNRLERTIWGTIWGNAGNSELSSCERRQN